MVKELSPLAELFRSEGGNGTLNLQQKNGPYLFVSMLPTKNAILLKRVKTSTTTKKQHQKQASVSTDNPKKTTNAELSQNTSLYNRFKSNSNRDNKLQFFVLNTSRKSKMNAHLRTVLNKTGKVWKLKICYFCVASQQIYVSCIDVILFLHKRISSQICIIL